MTMPECIRVADGGAAASRATVHSTPPLSAHRRRLAWFPTPGLGSASGIYALASPARWSASTTRSVRAQHSRGASSTASRPNRRCPKPRWCDDVGFDATAGAPGAPANGSPGADDQRTRTAVLSTAFGAGKSTGREAPAERLDRCVGDVHRSRHGDHGRTDRHQLIDPDPGRAVGQLGRDRLGPDRYLIADVVTVPL